MDDFVIWGSTYSEGSCVIEKPEGLKEPYLLTDGIELSDQWPEGVVCRMNDEFPKDIRLTDNLYGANSPVISQHLKERISVLAPASQIEFLPVTILNHKGRVASKDYFFLNPIGTVDCIDIEKSRVVWNAMNKTVISSVKQLTLSNGTVPEKVGILRPAYLTRTIFLRRSLSERLSQDGFTGLMFREFAKFRG
jgi:hypothetical protein